jgi:RecA-family ATPase
MNIPARYVAEPRHVREVSLLGTAVGNRWLLRKAAALVFAPAGVGKSTVVAQASTLWSLGQPAFGIKPSKPLRILCFQAEDARVSEAEKLNEQLRAATNPVVIRRIAVEMTPASGAQESLAVSVADTQYVLDELARVNAATEGAAGPAKRFANRLDLTRLGIFGM